MIFQSNSRQSRKQTAEEARDKEEGNNGGKEEEELWTSWEGVEERNGEANELKGLNILAIAIHDKQVKTQKNMT